MYDPLDSRRTMRTAIATRLAHPWEPARPCRRRASSSPRSVRCASRNSAPPSTPSAPSPTGRRPTSRRGLPVRGGRRSSRQAAAQPRIRHARRSEIRPGQSPGGRPPHDAPCAWPPGEIRPSRARPAPPRRGPSRRCSRTRADDPNQGRGHSCNHRIGPRLAVAHIAKDRLQQRGRHMDSQRDQSICVKSSCYASLRRGYIAGIIDAIRSLRRCPPLSARRSGRSGRCEILAAMVMPYLWAPPSWRQPLAGAHLQLNNGKLRKAGQTCLDTFSCQQLCELCPQRSGQVVAR